MAAVGVHATCGHPVPRSGRGRARRGAALLMAIIGLFAVALLATAAVQLTVTESTMQQNAQAGTQALYMADQGLSRYFQSWSPGSNLSGPLDLMTVIDTTDGEIDTSQVLADFGGGDLKSSDIVLGETTVRITPSKVMLSPVGDLYQVEATSTIIDPRPNRPPAVRSLRSYAQMDPPIAIRAALMAPGGLYAFKGNSNRIVLKGNKKVKCGVSTSVPGLATPAGVYDYKDAKKRDIGQSVNGVGHDSSTASYDELRDSLHYNWSQLSNAATYVNVPNSIVIPRDYPSLTAIPFKNFTRAGFWPVILVQGDLNITSGKETKGFGMLVVTGSLNVKNGVLKWDGLVLTGGRLTVVDGKDESHTHIKGAVAAGLGCVTNGDVASGKCRVELGADTKKDGEGEHLGVDFSLCNVEASVMGMMMLRPVTPTRHLRLY
jgi:hypothetical protein